jgi:hypothetical protein
MWQLRSQWLLPPVGMLCCRLRALRALQQLLQQQLLQ